MHTHYRYPSWLLDAMVSFRHRLRRTWSVNARPRVASCWPHRITLADQTMTLVSSTTRRMVVRLPRTWPTRFSKSQSLFLKFTLLIFLMYAETERELWSMILIHSHHLDRFVRSRHSESWRHGDRSGWRRHRLCRTHEDDLWLWCDQGILAKQQGL